jgi:hypothetical protein
MARLEDMFKGTFKLTLPAFALMSFPSLLLADQ